MRGQQDKRRQLPLHMRKHMHEAAGSDIVRDIELGPISDAQATHRPLPDQL